MIYMKVAFNLTINLKKKKTWHDWKIFNNAIFDRS